MEKFEMIYTLIGALTSLILIFTAALLERWRQEPQDHD